MSGARFQIGDTIRYCNGGDEPLGVVQSRTFDPDYMEWMYLVSFYESDGTPYTMTLPEAHLAHVIRTEADKVPEHYDAHYLGDVQPIELMQSAMSTEAFMGFLRGNIIKYACRLGKKDDVAKETTKILRYAEWLDKVAKGEKVNPRV